MTDLLTIVGGRPAGTGEGARSEPRRPRAAAGGAPADITLVNLNMLFLRHGEEVERELHLPLGPLYVARALEDAGFRVDFRDYQACEAADPFDLEAFLSFAADPAPVVGLSCMANLLPFTLLAMRALRERYPDRVLVLGGVGSRAVEERILERFPWVDVVARGEGERTAPALLRALQTGGDLSGVPGVSFRGDAGIVCTPEPARIDDLDRAPFPAWHKVDLRKYAGYGMMTSRGCPYPCTFCSVAPVWSHETRSRSPANVVAEMKALHRLAGVDLFLFQDEFFFSGKRRVMEFCGELERERMRVKWKAFGRVNLVDTEVMRAMAGAGCVELRFGVESGCDRVLERTKKGFRAADALAIIPRAVEILPRADAFFIWGFPDETLPEFHQTLLMMVSLRMAGARILPSLLSLLPQTEIYREWAGKAAFEFCPYLLPEFVFTGHEVLRGGTVEIPAPHRAYFELIRSHPDVFSGFYTVDLAGNILPKLALLRQFGFYPDPGPARPGPESCGAHSPRSGAAELATRTGKA